MLKKVVYFMFVIKKVMCDLFYQKDDVEKGMILFVKNYKYFMECFLERVVGVIKFVCFFGKVVIFNLYYCF